MRCLKTIYLSKRKNNVYKYHEDNWALFNANDLLTQLRHNVDHVDPKLLGTDGASLVHATGAIKKEKVPEVKKLIVKFANELAALKDDEDSEGNVHFFCGLHIHCMTVKNWINRSSKHVSTNKKAFA